MNWWKRNEKLEHITPRGSRWGESFDVIATLKERVASDDVLDFGCGDGRLVPAFDSAMYIGVDINPAAINHCRREFPHHRFELIDEDQPLPCARTALAYTVLLHLDEDAATLAAARLSSAAHRVIVVEIMDRKWRRPLGAPATFNRSVLDYIALFNSYYMRSSYVASYPYPRYGKDANINWLEFTH